MAQVHAELEIVLRWRRADDAFDVGLAYDDPSDPQDRRDYVDEPMTIDTKLLAETLHDPEKYGRILGGILLTPAKVRSFFDKAIATASARNIRLHFRLLIDPRAPARYHEIRWESIRDPETGSRVATRQNVLLSRYLSTPDWRPVPLPPWHRLTALVVIANPDVTTKTRVGRSDVPLDDIDVPDELRRAREALDGMRIRELAEPRTATLKEIVTALGAGVDLLYLVCHGGIYGEDPMLYLEDEQGMADVVAGTELVERIAELERPPTLVVLCSCQSAGKGDDGTTSDEGTLSALGPRLAGAGVAAVVGMQGNITMRTAAKFFPAFFTELRKDGVVDRAMAVARGMVSQQQDWWMPVLYTRLRLGRGWYEPEFGVDGDVTFRALINNINEGVCTPVLGSGIAGERILPSREDLAANWADQWLMPIAAPSRLDLAKVAQYLSVRTAPRQTQTEVGLYLRTELRGKFDSTLAPEARTSEKVADLIRSVGRQFRQADRSKDPYSLLADLKLPIYVTTSWTSLLEDAIADTGVEPTVRHFDWHRSRRDDDAFPEPTPDQPLVYHLFGTLDDPASLVVTEDHYFAWLRAWMKRVDKDESIPRCVATALTDSSLLFLGYHLDDWEFRVLFHSIKSFQGSALLEQSMHVGVQVSPTSSTIEPEVAQDYLGKYFDKQQVHIYWGTCERFLEDLVSRRSRRG
jgi:CHAT domain/SIR2-like domain